MDGVIFNVNNLKCAGFSQDYRQRPQARCRHEKSWKARAKKAPDQGVHLLSHMTYEWTEVASQVQSHIGTYRQSWACALVLRGPQVNALCDHELGLLAVEAATCCAPCSAWWVLSFLQHCRLVGAAGSPQAWGHVVLQETSPAHSKTLAPSPNSEKTQAFQIAFISIKAPQLGLPNHVSSSFFNFQLSPCFPIPASVIITVTLTSRGTTIQSPDLSPFWPHYPQGSCSLPLLWLDSCHPEWHHYIQHPGFKHPFWPPPKLSRPLTLEPQLPQLLFHYPSLSLLHGLVYPSRYCFSSTLTFLPLISCMLLKGQNFSDYSSVQLSTYFGPHLSNLPGQKKWHTWAAGHWNSKGHLGSQAIGLHFLQEFAPCSLGCSSNTSSPSTHHFALCSEKRQAIRLSSSSTKSPYLPGSHHISLACCESGTSLLL